MTKHLFSFVFSIFTMKKNKIWHILFLVGVFFKGLDGVLETLGGLIFLFLRHGALEKFARIVFRGELAEDPHDIIANYLINLAAHTSRDTEFFAAIFLLVHGAIKISIVTGLYLRKLWIYPLAEIILSLFVLYQLYRFSHTFSVLLIFISIVDIFIIFLIRTEHKRLKGLPGS
jgi:uncharacterized membrane protein